jgi:hypothetical protein
MTAGSIGNILHDERRRSIGREFHMKGIVVIMIMLLLRWCRRWWQRHVGACEQVIAAAARGQYVSKQKAHDWRCVHHPGNPRRERRSS